MCIFHNTSGDDICAVEFRWEEFRGMMDEKEPKMLRWAQSACRLPSRLPFTLQTPIHRFEEWLFPDFLY